MKTFFLILAVFFSFAATAQVTRVDLQASGLTCSMCSNAIHKALRSLDFVDRVDPDISNSSFNISFKPGKTIDLDKLRTKVEDAGFSVANFSVTVNFSNVQTANDDCVFFGTMGFHLLNSKETVLNGEKKIRVMDKGFLSAKEYKKNAPILKGNCKPGVKDARIYHVTIS